MKRLAAHQQKVRAGLPSEEPEHSFSPSVLDTPATASAPFGAASPELEDAAPQVADPLSEPGAEVGAGAGRDTKYRSPSIRGPVVAR